jgi:3-hydroxybutyryl-CoA dehydrogenase
MHFFNPAPVMRLVEVVATVLSDDAAVDTVVNLTKLVGKTPVRVVDRAGFIANALLLPYLNQALEMFASGYASAGDIDLAVTAGLGMPMGPLALLDLIGLDTALSILEVMTDEFGSTRYIPAPLLRRLVAAGWVGKKAGRGVYEYLGGHDPCAAAAADVAESGAAAPDTVTVIGAGDEQESNLATALASAGLNVTRNAAHPTELVLIVAESGQSVLPAALATGRPGQAVGLHLGAGVHDPSLAELVRTNRTSDKTMQAAIALAARLGLRFVRAPDRAGFLIGALLYPHLADAVRMVEYGYATAADIDAAMMLGCGYPRGPFQLIDDAGAADVLIGLRAMYLAYGYPWLVPPPLLTEHAAAGIEFVGVGRGAGGCGVSSSWARARRVDSP